MKCLVLSVVVIAVAFTVNCRDVPGRPEGKRNTQQLVEETALTELDVPAQPQGRTDKSQQLVKTDIAAQNKERAEDREIEIKSRKNKCKEDDVCADKGGECIGKKDICSGTIVSGICGKKCECCVVDNIDMKIDTLELQLTNKIDNQTSDIDEIIVNLKGDMDEIIVDQTSDLDEIIVNLKGDIENELQGMVRNMTNLLESIETKLTGLDCFGTLIGGQCFTFSQEALTWADAGAACNTAGGRLAIALNPSDLLSYVIKTYGRGTVIFWLGGSDIETEGKWVWDNGVPVPNDLPWSARNPDGAGGQNCLAINYSGGYDDDGCSVRRVYICETGIME